ncbi:LamB/YcsF family protein [Cryobacterium sp. M91]|uniref:LamB/YcsF family protein n=1 Tax=Cryobacterium sp. M91 TaxID=2048294 RepID=UPI000CE52830
MTSSPAPAPARTVTVNSDLGESFGNDLQLMKSVDVANVACGFHSGDPATMAATVEAAADHGLKVGAHPGLPDLVGFGRREMRLTPRCGTSTSRCAADCTCAREIIRAHHIQRRRFARRDDPVHER